MAFAVPVAVAAPPLSLPRFTPNITFAFRTADRADPRVSGDTGDPVPVGAYGMLPGLESAAAAGAPVPTGAASGAGAGETAPGSKPLQEVAQVPQAAQGATAFEARIQLSASDLPDKPGPQSGGAHGDGPVAGTSHGAPQSPTSAAPSHPSPAQAGDQKSAGNAEPVKPSPDHGNEPSPGNMPAADGTGQDSGGQEQQDSASPKKESDAPARESLDDSLRAADPQTPGATVSAAAAGSSGGVTAPRSEPAAPLIAHDAGADAVSPPASAPARDIAIQLQDPGGPRVDVQLMDRAGTVHVVVRTQDDGLVKDLRTNLPDLAQKLSQQGMEADAWSPVEMHSAAGGHENFGHAREQTAEDSHSPGGGQDSGGSQGDQWQRQPQDPEDEFNQSFSGLLTGVTAWQPTR
ncbi:MAG: hypothetical protein ABSF98_10660 [Bryobacteraceae bacterium]